MAIKFLFSTVSEKKNFIIIIIIIMVFHISKAHIHKFIFIPGTLYRNYPILDERKVGKRNLEKINGQ